jgi:hypothetical protein
MAIQDAEREAIIARIKSESPAVQDFCALAFALGHEEGWWLARTDPDTTVSPVKHSTDTNPFLTEKPDDGPVTKWGVSYKGEVTEYPDEAEARKQWNFACMDIPASLMKWDNGKWITVLDNGNYVYPA